MSIVERFSLDIPATIKTSSYDFLAQDSGTEVQFESSSALTANLLPVLTAGNGYNILVRNIGSGSLTLSSNGAELIDGSASDLVMAADEFRWLRSDGTEWKSITQEASGTVTSIGTSGGLTGGTITSTGTISIADAGVTVEKLENDAKAYDFSFVAGFDETMTLEDIAVQTYGEVVVARALTIEGAVGYIDTVATGTAVEVDVLKNGVSIYTTEPSFPVSTNTMTDQTPTTTSLVSGDRLTFKVIQIGSTIAGQGLRFTLKTRLA